MGRSGVWMSVVFSVSLLLVLSFASPVLAATYFQDDFNSYTTNAELWAAWPKANLDELFIQEGTVGGGVSGDYTAAENADWQLNSLYGNRTNPPTRDGSPSTGQSISCDSDKAGSNDNDNYELGYSITSPAFNTTGASNVYLHFSCDATLNETDGTCFEVYVSGDNGASWTMVLQRVSPGRWRFGNPDPTPDNADGIFGVVDLNISAVAANKSQVKTRFICRGNSDSWYILVDDVVVDNIDYGITGTTTLLANEPFTSVADGAIPAGWERTSGCNENPWQVGNLYRHYTVNPDSGGFVYDRTVNRLDTKYATFDSDQDPDTCPDNEFLITPAVNTTGYNLVYLIFDSEIVQHSAANERVEVSTDNGTTWREQAVWSYQSKSQPGNESNYLRHVVPVFGIGNNTQVKFRFAYTGPGDSWWWAIDNVSVTGGGGDLPPGAPTVSNPKTLFSLDEAVSAGGLTGFVTSAFNPTGGETHGRTDFQVIRLGGDFASPMLAGTINSGNLLQFAILGLGSPGDYQVRARHVTTGGVPGSYGPPFNFQVGGPTGTYILFNETFDSLAGSLRGASDELAGVGCTAGIADPNFLGWTHTPPAGWTIDNSLMGTVGGEPTGRGNGVDEWYGWCFTTVAWWDDAGGGQDRALFTRASGVCVVTDPDEWDDCDGAAGGGAFNSTLISPTLDIPAGKDVTILFDSHYWQESSPGLMEGQLRYSANGQADVVLLHYCYNNGEGCSDNPGVDGNIPDNKKNISVMKTIQGFPSATQLVFKWETFNGANDWYWAIDNVFVFVEGEPTSIEEWSQY